MAAQSGKRTRERGASEQTASKKSSQPPRAAKRKATEDASPNLTKKQKAIKAGPAEIGALKGSSSPKTRKPKKSTTIVEPDAEDQSSEEEVDDNTQSLARLLDPDSEDEDQEGGTFEEGQDVGIVPKVPDKVTKSAKSSGKEDTGVVYIGHIPRGFFEHEIRSYFSQFGRVEKIRVARSRKTGNSKGYAFVEFEEDSTADIVVKTMNNYLLFGHVLKLAEVPKSQIHENLWRGANKRFKTVPWNQIAGSKLEQPKSEAAWTQKIEKEQKRRASRAEKLKALGYEYEAPKLKSAGEALNGSATLENKDEALPLEDGKAIEAEPGQSTGETARTEPTKRSKAKAGKAKMTAKEKRSQAQSGE